MNNRLPNLIATLPTVGLTLALIATNATAQKTPASPEGQPPSQATKTQQVATQKTAVSEAPLQQVMADAEPDEEMVFEDAPPLQVGDSAMGLLALQREGHSASPTPRPIAGDVAHRSYERYLKSFEFPIPERFSSTVKSKSDPGSGGR